MRTPLQVGAVMRHKVSATATNYQRKKDSDVISVRLFSCPKIEHHSIDRGNQSILKFTVSTRFRHNNHTMSTLWMGNVSKNIFFLPFIS